MGKKYIIEVEDEEVSFDHGLFMHIKTGRTFPEIAEILQKMKEES